jgi:hypothetical protein
LKIKPLRVILTARAVIGRSSRLSTHVHIYDLASGLFTGQAHHTHAKDPEALAGFIEASTPSGHGAYIGKYVDYLSKKVDVHTGLLTEYQPPPPSRRHVWNEEVKRWQVKNRKQRQITLARIAQLETSTHRAVRETLLRACEALDALKEAVVPQSAEVREAVDRLYSCVARLEVSEGELDALRREL